MLAMTKIFEKLFIPTLNRRAVSVRYDDSRFKRWVERSVATNKNNLNDTKRKKTEGSAFSKVEHEH